MAFHNGVTQWTICNIMKEFTAAKRAAVIVKFIDVAMVCLSVRLSVCLSVFVHLYNVFVCVYVQCMYVFVSMSKCPYVYMCLSVCMHVCI